MISLSSEVHPSGLEAATELEESSDHEAHVGMPDEENFDVDFKDDEVSIINEQLLLLL